MAERLILDITGKTKPEFTKEVQAVLEKGIEDVFQSERWVNWLIFCSGFHSYSAKNRLLIYLQMPWASIVAPMSKWNEKYDRKVIKGQGPKGLKIFAPTKFSRLMVQPKLDENGSPLRNEKGEVITERVKVQVPGYVPVSVYDVSQTEGKPLPKLSNPLEGEYERCGEVIAAIRAISKAPIFISDFESQANGVFLPSDRDYGIIRVKPDMADEQTIKTMLHELAHSRLHNKSTIPPKPREMEEFEAESIAFIVSNYLGIDTSSYSFSYLAGWSYGKTQELLDSTLETVVTEADKIIKELDIALSHINIQGYRHQAMIQDYLENSEYLNEIHGFQEKPLEEKVEFLNRSILQLENMVTPVAVEVCWSETPRLQDGEIYTIEEMDAMFSKLDMASRQDIDQAGFRGCYDKVMFRVYYQDTDFETGEVRAGNIRTRYDFGDLTHETFSDFLRETPVYRMLLDDLLPQREEGRKMSR